MEVFREDLVWLGESFESKAAFFEAVSERLYEKGLVKDSFAAALAKREEDFSTGLKTEAVEVAIPHTDVEHVNEPFIAFVRFGEPLTFMHMGGTGDEVHAQFAFVLGVTDPSKQVEVLKTLIALITDKGRMDVLAKAGTPGEIASFLNDIFAQAGLE